MRCFNCEEDGLEETGNQIKIDLGEEELNIKEFHCNECGVEIYIKSDHHFCDKLKRLLPFPAIACSSCNYGNAFNGTDNKQ